MREFQSFRGFASHLAMLAATGEEVTSFAAKEGAKIVADDAKARIGEYQDGVGPYGAWANLAPSTIDDRLSKGFTPDDPLLRSGELWNSIVVVSQGNVAGAAGYGGSVAGRGDKHNPAKAISRSCRVHKQRKNRQAYWGNGDRLDLWRRVEEPSYQAIANSLRPPSRRQRPRTHRTRSMRALSA